MTTAIKFDRTPYKVSWRDSEGVQQTIRRVPPPKLHDALPKDQVRLSRTVSSTFKEGESFEVKHINPRHPNTLQLVNSEGKTTFVGYHDIALKKGVSKNSAEIARVEKENIELTQDHLRWP